MPFASFARGRGLVELRCRVCGTAIGRQMPVGAQRTRRVGNQTFIETDMQFAYLAAYREVEIAMEGGGRHIGNACASCAERLEREPELLARFYETDLTQWRSEGHQITATMDRTPKRVTRVADYIKD